MKNNDFISGKDGSPRISNMKIHRIIEVSSIAAFLAMEFLLFRKIMENRVHFSLDISTAAVSVFLTVILSYIGADFISGYVHFLGDSFGDFEFTTYKGSYMKALLKWIMKLIKVLP